VPLRRANLIPLTSGRSCASSCDLQVGSIRRSQLHCNSKVVYGPGGDSDLVNGVNIEQLQARGIKARRNQIDKAFQHFVAEIVVFFALCA